MTSHFVLRNALLFDGSGRPARPADVEVRGEFIENVAAPGTLSAPVVRDVSGLALAPGFIDVHSHSDLDIVKFPSADNKISQGFTTDIAGNCGFSEYHEQGMDFSEYANTVEAARPAINIAALAGHNSIRSAVMGNTERPPTRAELDRMRSMLADALAQGAAGFSAGLWYVPGIYADTAELRDIASVLKGTGKPFAIHLRSEGDTLTESIAEACEIARAGSGILQLSHFKTWYPRNWHKLSAAFELIEKERRSGLSIAGDRYPYLYSGTGLRMALPAAFSRIPKEELHARLRDSGEFRAEAVAASECAGPADCPWERILLLDSDDPSHKVFFGKSMPEIADEWQCSAAAACVRILSGEDVCPLGAFGLMCEENLKKILAQPWIYPGTDAGIQLFSKSNGHPRKFGTAARFFRSALRSASPEAVIRRMTALPAQRFHLSKRGLVRPGFYADLTLFDWNEFNAEEDYTHPAAPAEGIVSVYVNGMQAYENARIARAGKFLKCTGQGGM